MSDAPPEANSAILRVKTGPLAGPILTRVVAMMLARAGCPVDRLDDAMVICEALAAHAAAHTQDGQVRFTVRTRPGALELRVGALVPEGAQRLAEAAEIPGVGSVLEPIADEVRVEPAGGAGNDELVLELGFPSAEPAAGAEVSPSPGRGWGEGPAVPDQAFSEPPPD